MRRRKSREPRMVADERGWMLMEEGRGGLLYMLFMKNQMLFITFCVAFITLNVAFITFAH
jgi:hypothetical protein